MTILYADDDIDDRDLVLEALREIDPSISCMTATNGREVLDMLEKGSCLPDYILLDINMPGMNGKECLAALKRNERLKSIPVVIYSTTSDIREIDEYLGLGALTFIRKPHTFTALCAAMRIFLPPDNGKKQDRM
ncbi:MAG TPA: response regulator [Ohtaekwangia sp.]|nr:response regulator [Ohtaekwangia sp.]